MKIFNKFLCLITGVTALTCCLGCGGGSSPTPPGPTPPTPTESTTTVKAKQIEQGSKIVFQYTGDGDCTVNWGDGTDNDTHNVSHTYLASFEEVTITITGKIAEINFLSYSDNNNECISSIELGDAISKISSYAFQNCENLSEIIIPISVTTVGGLIFSINAYPQIFCGAESQPEGWHGNWNALNCPCYWGYLSNGTQDGLSYIATKAGTYITKYVGTAATIEIPNKLGGQPVISINDRIFANHSEITSVTLPDSLQNIGGHAFDSCSNLSEIVIPNSVTTMGADVFHACSSLVIYCEADEKQPGWADNWNSNCPCYWGYLSKGTQDGLSYVVTKTGSYITKYTGADTAIEIPNKLGGQPVIGIGNGAFAEHPHIAFIILPDSLQKIGAAAFDGCIGLLSINIPSSVTSIGEYAFSNCASLLEIVIPNSVTTMGTDVFGGHNSLAIYCEAEEEQPGWADDWNSDRPYYLGYLSKGGQDGLSYIVTKTGSYITKYTGAAATIEIPNKLGGQPVIGIGNGAFAECSDITFVTLPDSLQKIGAFAFDGCSSLTGITLPSSVTSIGECAFVDCDSLSIDLTKFSDASALPDADDTAFVFSDCEFKVSSETMRDAFIAKGGGWPTDPAKYSIG